MAQGVMVFRSLTDAIQAGYQVYDKTATGYLVRSRTSSGFVLAIVEVIA
jgi:hypothetical protein